MTHEDPAHGRAPADARDVEVQSTEEEPHGAAAWAKVPRYVATMTLPKDALRVFIVLSSYADGRERLAWPSQDTIARDLGWIAKSTGRPDRSRISTAIKALLEADLVRKAGRQRNGVRAWTTRYVVAPFPEEGLYDSYNTSDPPAREVVRNRVEGSYEIGRGVVSGRAQIDPISDQLSDQRSEKPATKKRHEDEGQGNHKLRAGLTDEERARRRREFEELVEAEVQSGSGVMGRENAKSRAVRFLGEGRVMVVRAGPAAVLAIVRGDSGSLREVRWDPRRGWSCDCPALTYCAHAIAVASVVLVGQADGRWTDLEAVIA